MWNPPELPKHNKAYQAPDSTLNSLMRDVDSYLLELNEEEQPPFAPPARSHSLQEPQRQSPILANRSNTTHRAYNSSNGSRADREEYPNYATEQRFPGPPKHVQSAPSYQGYYQPPPLPLKNGLRPALAASVEPIMAMPQPPPYSNLQAQPSYNPYSASYNELHMYPQYDNNQPDYVSTYLNNYNRQRQEKVAAEDSPASRSSSIMSSHKTYRNSDSSATLVDIRLDRNSNLFVNTQNVKPTTTPVMAASTMDQSISSSPLSTPSAITPIAFVSQAYASVSILSRAFARRVQGLEHVRELFCANEYPESFTGQEAVNMLQQLLDGIPESYCILVANALMKAKPPLFDPIHYSQKSIIQGTVFNSPDEYYTLQEDMTDEQVPTGLLTSLLECYTYNCQPGKGGCYAPRCPNKPEVFALEFYLHDPSSIASSAVDNSKSRPPSDQIFTANALSTQPHMAWAQRAPKSLLSSLSKSEIARQEAINEIIYSEEVYKNDLETLYEVIVAPLLKKSIITSTKKREEFVKEVFVNYKELTEVSTALFTDLFDLQRQHEQECVPMIGDILIKHFAYFEDPFSRYCPRVSLAEYLVKEEERNNPDFERFIVQVEKSKRMRRLAFRHFLLNPVTRMQRYPLLLRAILKNTDVDHPDYTYLSKCLDMVKKVASQSDAMAEIFKRRVEILNINDLIRFKQGEFQDLQLTDPLRRLYYQGDIKRRSNGIEMTEKADIHMFIFDHMVLMTKPRRPTATSSTVEEYRVWRRAVPLQMLYVGSASDVSSPGATSTTRTYLHGPSYTSTGLLPLTLHHLGQKGGVHTFLCSSEEKQKWLTSIEEAKASMKKRMGVDVYDLVTLDDSSFRYVAAPNGSAKQGKVNCTVPFMTAHNEQKMAVGTDTGVYFKAYGVQGIRKVLNCENVSQIEVLEKYHILLVLSDKTLKAYPLDLLNNPTVNGKAPERLGQELGQHVNYFQVGVCNNRDLVIFKKKRNTSSTFTALQPAYDLRDPKNQKYITQKTGFMIGRGSNHSWFKKYKEFYVGADSSNIHFLKSKFAVVCERGFEIIEPENLSVGGRDIPDKMDPQFNFVHRQAESIKPLAMYRVHDKFLLCYSKFAFYVNNRNGSLVQRGPQKLNLLCEWEGTPENIIFVYPYIIAFDPQFIEIRHVDTGDLVQIIPGDQIRLTYFQTIGESTVIHGCMTHSQRPEMQNVFYLKLNSRRSSNSRKYL